ncbi:MOXD1 homolog 1 [Onthophagus taurus]|uniref:MOXD1 homolog 1 n=1 Tax=Onthophagus taurus TaxID=166361 RepID=UPI0039BE8763
MLISHRKMIPSNFYLIFFNFLLIKSSFSSPSSSPSEEDLLDEYVNHVGRVNSVRKPTKNENKVIFNFGANRKLKSVVDSALIEEEQWTHSEFLDAERKVLLRWQPRHQEILFRIEAKTLGYVGIGFSPNGGMEQADIVIGWVDKYGKAVLLDCHGVPKSQGSAPVKDEHDNYTLMKGIENGTHTILEFRRALDTCDPDDYALSSDTVRAIWALHDKDPHADFEMIYHGEKRGSQSLHLFGPPPIVQNENPDFLRTWDVTLKDFTINDSMDTVYWCKIFKAPTLQLKHHIIGYEPVIGTNHTGFVHHMLLHECEVDLNQLQKRMEWDSFSKEKGRRCYTPEMPLEWEKCTTPIVAWAIGSKGENFPPHVGLPLDNAKTKYYMLEVHFDNPRMRRAQDTSGIALKYTGKLRNHDGGVMATGISISEFHIVPPRQKEYKSVGFCTADCTKEVFPRDGVNVVSVLLHSHLAGRKLKLRHLRGGKELIPLAEDDHYDFNYQQSRQLSHEIKILPGDSLITECSYKTSDRKSPTFGGYSTQEEMCLAFILYYPKTELAGCFSMPPIKYFFETLGVKEFYNTSWNELQEEILHAETVETSSVSPKKDRPLFTYQPGDEYSAEAHQRAVEAILKADPYLIETDPEQQQSPFGRLIIKEPFEFQNKSFLAHLQDIPYEEALITKKIEEYFHKGLHLTFCRKRDGSLAIKENVERFPNFTEYNLSKQSQCSYRSRVSRNNKNSAVGICVRDDMFLNLTRVFLASFVFWINTTF